MFKENTEIFNKINFKEEKQKNIQNKEGKDTNLNSFNFTIKNSSSKAYNNYYTICIKNETETLSINAQDKNDEKLIFSKKYTLSDLHNFTFPEITKLLNISEIYSFLQNIILLGNKAQITMDKPEDEEDNLSLIIKIINDTNKIIFNLQKDKIENNNCINELEKKSLSETEEHIHDGSDLTKNYPPFETKDITNSVSSKDKEKENKSNIDYLGKKRNNEQNLDNFNENEICTNLIIQKGVKNKESDYLDLVKDLSGKPEEKIFPNNQSLDDSNNDVNKENNKNGKINYIDNEIKNQEEIIINKNIENNDETKMSINIDTNNNINQIINENKENNNSNVSNDKSNNEDNGDNNLINYNNNGKRKLIFSIQNDKYIPNDNEKEKSKFKSFIVIRNGMFPKSFYQNYPQFGERRRRRKGEKIEEDEEEFKVYNVINPNEEKVIRLSTPMKLRAKTEYIDLSENEDSPSLNNDLNFNKNNKKFILENDLLKSQIIQKKEQIDLLIESLEKINKNRDIEEEENESNTICKIHLLYLATDDGSSSFMFHEKCDGKKNLLIIIHTDANIIFGGFTKKSFDSKKINKKADRNSFIFNLNKLKVYKGIVGRIDGNYIEPGILSQKKNGPCFLNDAIFIGNNLLGDIGHVGEKQCGYDTKTDYEINNGDKFFKAKEIEIYQVIFNDLIFLE